MINRLLILLIGIAFVGCSEKLTERVDCSGYTVGSIVDDKWTVESEDVERKFKNLRNKNDTNLYARSIADTIWVLELTNISEDESINLIKKYNECFDASLAEKKQRKVANIWDCIFYEWADPMTGDDLFLEKCKNVKGKKYGSWIFELSNRQLLIELKSNHDSYPSLAIIEDYHGLVQYKKVDTAEHMNKKVFLNLGDDWSTQNGGPTERMLLLNEQRVSHLFDYIQKGDSLVKLQGEMSVKVYRNMKDSIFHIDIK